MEPSSCSPLASAPRDVRHAPYFVLAWLLVADRCCLFIISMLMAIELMLLSVRINFVAFSHYLGNLHGQVFALFTMVVAAAKLAIGLTILVLLFRRKRGINVGEFMEQKG